MEFRVWSLAVWGGLRAQTQRQTVSEPYRSRHVTPNSTHDILIILHLDFVLLSGDNPVQPIQAVSSQHALPSSSTLIRALRRLKNLKQQQQQSLGFKLILYEIN